MGLLGCGDTGNQATISGSRRTTHAPELAIREAQRAAAFAAFGEGASTSERAAISGVLYSYYSAISEGHFERGCSLLSRNARAAVARTRGGHGNANERSCAKRLGEILAKTIGERNERSQFTVVGAKEVRLKRGEGYVVFTTAATGLEQHALSVIREGGNWRVTSPIALPIIYAVPAALAP
jgi:hypothetical protein